MSDSTQSFFTMSQRFNVLQRDNFTCRYCGAKAPDVVLEVDHVLPVTLGGRGTMENGVTACRPCNRGKINKHLDDLAKTPVAMSDLVIRKTFEDRAKEYATESQAKHEYRCSLWDALVKTYDLDPEDIALREGIAEASMDWFLLGVPLELPVAVFAELIYWYGHRRLVNRKTAPKIKVADKYIEMVGDCIRSCMASAIADA